MPHTQALQTESERLAWLGHNHGYRIAGDLACLHADFAIAEDALQRPREQWALQLWACDAPYAGGSLSGTKIAETVLEQSGPDVREPQRCYAETFARLPAGERDYSMVLVLASRDAAREHVHDFANYPAREFFYVPSLRGEVSVTDESEQVHVRIERIVNPRGPENLSGTLALELWALRDAYTGGPFAGVPLAGIEIGRLSGQESREHTEYRLASATAPEDHPYRALMLREWTADGYVTRDYRGLSAQVPAASSDTADRGRADATEIKAIETKTADEVREAAAPAQPATRSAGLVSIQHASVDELARVPGLNRKLAVEIIKARPYRALDELKRVRGIGDKTLRKLRALLAL